MTNEEAMRLRCDERTLVARAAAEDVKCGDVVYIDFKQKARRLRSTSAFFAFDTYYALNDAGAGFTVALFGTDWPR